MKTKLLLLAALLTSIQVSLSQGTFQNLDFEAADVSGDQAPSLVPTTSAFPGWQAFYGASATAQVVYDGISIGAPEISIVDNYPPYGLVPIQGNYTAYLFSASPTISSLSQMATVPGGTESLQLDASQSALASFVVTLGGETINMAPLQTFSGYTLYGADVSSFSGQDVTLTISELPPTNPEYSPSMLELDNIVFSPNAVPEPSIVALSAIGGLLFGARKWFAVKVGNP